MSLGGPFFFRNRRVIGNPLPNFLDRASCAVTTTSKVVVKPAILNGTARQRCRGNAKLRGVLFDLCGDAECVHALNRDICPHHVKWGFLSPIGTLLPGLESRHG